MAAANPPADPDVPTNDDVFMNVFIRRLKEEADKDLNVANNLRSTIRMQLQPKTIDPQFVIYRKIVEHLGEMHRQNIGAPQQHNTHTMTHQATMQYIQDLAHDVWTKERSWMGISYIITMAAQVVAESAAVQANLRRCSDIHAWIEMFFNINLDDLDSITRWIKQQGGWSTIRKELLNPRLQRIPTLQDMNLTEDDFLSTEDCTACNRERIDGCCVGCEQYSCIHDDCYYANDRVDRIQEHVKKNHNPDGCGLMNNCSCLTRKVTRGTQNSGICAGCGAFYCLIGVCTQHTLLTNTRMLHFTVCHPGLSPHEPHIQKGHVCSCGAQPDVHGRCAACGYTCPKCGGVYLSRQFIEAHFARCPGKAQNP